MARVTPTSASSIAAFLGAPLHGADMIVQQVNGLPHAVEGALTFMQHCHAGDCELLNRLKSVFVIADASAQGQLTCSHVMVPDPRLAFALVAQRFFEVLPEPGIAQTAQVHSGAHLGRNVSVGHYAVIDADVEIGEDTVISHHVVIRSRTRIGKRGLILSHVMIGEPGFGFDFRERVPVRIPHFGGVIIGNDVQIGCGTTISCATLENTRIEDDVKIDNQVVVAHNCIIGRGSVVTAGAVLCGRTRIDEFTWIGANSTIREGGIQIGEGAMLGLGAVALAPVAPFHVVMGNPARVLRKRNEAEEF